jgi:PEP-CTERM motif
MTTRLLTCAAFLLMLGILTPINADPSLRAQTVAEGLLRENPGRHLALGHYKQNASLALPDDGDQKVLIIARGRSTGDLHLHGYKDQQPPIKVVANPEPATIVLLGSGLIGVLAAVRKRRQNR